MPKETSNNVLAAIDLGSNSFHMIIARQKDGYFQIVDRMREMVQLRTGLDEQNNLSAEVQQRALDCLKRFGERIGDLPYENVRAVGTNTLRLAQNSREFMQHARVALGRPIEIVAGDEEARLIYLGVAHSLAFDDRRRLVMDIGGGSTEFIIGEGFSGLKRESLEMGCVSFSQRFFPSGETTEEAMKAAILAASSLIRFIQRPYRKAGWEEVIGASGTIRSVANICRDQGWSDDGVITAAAIKQLVKHLISAGHVKDAKLKDLSEERSRVLPGGVCVLAAAFERLGFERMTVSDGAMREGLLYDLLGRLTHDDERSRTVEAMAKRYDVDRVHAEHVGTMATQLFEQVAQTWQINTEEYLQRLQWAATLHEVGLALSHSQFHKHSAYLIGESDLQGFSREEQHALAVIVRGQRRSFPKKYIQQLPEELQQSTQRLTILLRLAMVFNRGRSDRTDTDLQLMVADKKLTLILPKDWLAQHPLTESELQQEVAFLKKIDVELQIIN